MYVSRNVLLKNSLLTLQDDNRSGRLGSKYDERGKKTYYLFNFNLSYWKIDYLSSYLSLPLRTEVSISCSSMSTFS